MTLIQKNIDQIKNFPKENFDLLKKIITKLHQNLEEKRSVMYSDIINLIVRKGKIGEKYNKLILWCNYKIRLGEFIVNIQ